MNPIYRSRRRNDIIVRALCVGAALFGVTWLALILFTLFYNGLAGLNWQVFTQNTPPPGSTDGGLLNAIVGSVIMTVIGVGIGAPLLFTALSNQFFSLDLTKTMANLPVTINNFVQSPYAYWKQLAWSGALLITLTVLALNIGARILAAERTAK